MPILKGKHPIYAGRTAAGFGTLSSGAPLQRLALIPSAVALNIAARLVRTAPNVNQIFEVETSLMTEKTTWTHVDRLVRKRLEDSGTIPFGETDAEVAMGYISFLERSLKTQTTNGDRTFEELRRTRIELEEVKARVKPLKKTKQRLADLEENVDFIRRHLGLEL